jgi:uncharacterized repeat protein (TIGR03803 family)
LRLIPRLGKVHLVIFWAQPVLAFEFGFRTAQEFRRLSMKPKSALVARVGLVVILAALLFAGATLAAASTEFVVYSFPNTTIPILAGCQPQGNLAADAAGNLFGTAGCGALNHGVVFKMTRPNAPSTVWTESVLYSFTGGSDGDDPVAGVILDAAGNLYGTTSAGGASGHGTVFELSPPAAGETDWTESMLYSFQGGTGDGDKPLRGVVFDGAGNLYGTTFQGGLIDGGYCRAGCGTVFQLAPPTTAGGAWTETVIHFFFGGQGSFPLAAPILDAKGDLYGTTRSGGKADAGLVYRLAPPAAGQTTWAYKVLHAFAGGSTDGAAPFAGVTLHGKGVLYGTTANGGSGQFGTVFQLAPPAIAGGAWIETVLFNFSGLHVVPNDAANPAGNLVFDAAGNIYGMAGGGGDYNDCFAGCGAVFQLSPPAAGSSAWTETLLHTFGSGKDTASPSGGLVFGKNGVLFGVSLIGGSKNEGTVFGVVK